MEVKSRETAREKVQNFANLGKTQLKTQQRLPHPTLTDVGQSIFVSWQSIFLVCQSILVRHRLIRFMAGNKNIKIEPGIGPLMDTLPSLTKIFIKIIQKHLYFTGNKKEKMKEKVKEI